MTPQEIVPGTRLELEFVNRNGEKIGNTYVSQLLENQENGHLVISAPIFEARLIFIPLQAQIRLVFMHPKYGLLAFSAKVIAREYRGNIAVLIIEPEGKIEKTQRRSHYRLDLITDVLVWIGGKDNVDGKPPIKASTKNISGSGICIVTEVNIQRKTEVDVEFYLNDSILISAGCVVIRSNFFEVKNKKSYEIGLHFMKLSPKDQDSIIRYIFEQQRILLKRETQ